MEHFDISELEAAVFPDEAPVGMDENEEVPETDMEEMISEEPLEELELELNDGQVLVCEILDVFAHDDREYMVLHPKEDTEGVVHLMRIGEGEGGVLKLSPIEDEEELQRAAEIFQKNYEDIKTEQ